MAPSPFEAAATLAKSAFDAEFATEGFKLIYDNPYDSLGEHRVVAGIYPVEDRARAGNALIQETVMQIKFLGLWQKMVKPDQMVNPFKVTAYAERLRVALRNAERTDPGTGQLWYFLVDDVSYPDDPTGNKTRFVMTVRALGENSGIVETVA